MGGVMLLCAALLFYRVVEALWIGTAVSLNRFGPSRVYPLASHPLGFWLTLILHGSIGSALAWLSRFCFRVAKVTAD